MLIIQLKATNSSNNGIRTNHGDGIRTSPNDIIFTYHTDVICTNHSDTIHLSWWSRYDQSTFDIYSEKSEWFHGEKGIFDWKPFFKYMYLKVLNDIFLLTPVDIATHALNDWEGLLAVELGSKLNLATCVYMHTLWNYDKKQA